MGRQSALCIGCNYPQKAFGLLGAVNDAYLWADLLQRRFGFQPQDVTLLVDCAPGNRKEKVDPAFAPTRLNILSNLQRLVHDSRKGD